MLIKKETECSQNGNAIGKFNSNVLTAFAVTLNGLMNENKILLVYTLNGLNFDLHS